MSISTAQTWANTAPANTISAQYEAALKKLRGSIVTSRSHQLRALIALVGGVVVFSSLMYVAITRQSIARDLSVIPLIGVGWALREYLRFHTKSLELAHICGFYERGLDRLQGLWRGRGHTGIEFARENHLFQHDLAILGDSSLFELICTTRSEAGADRLASFLLDSVGLEEANARQEAVRELQDRTYLREQIASLGKYQFQRCDGLLLRDWLRLSVLTVPRAIPIFLLASSLICLILFVLGLAQLLNWSLLAALLAPLLIAQASIGVALMRRVRPMLRKLLPLENEFVVLRQGLDLMQRQHFSSAKLIALVRRVQDKNASLQVRRIELLAQAVEQRGREWFHVPSLLLTIGTQLVLAVDRWRTQHGDDFVGWLDAWAEFDALNALACYAYEHPDDVFPELLDGAARLEGVELGHPLLPPDRCVGNDLVLSGASPFCVISGSNMAGKSTFLRAIGINSVLASAGAPIRARSARMSVFNLCASISLADSLTEGKSKFLTELERLREMIRCVRAGKPVLFLIDEILSGTNSRDRRIAAESVIRTLIVGGGVGALSTHDLALTEIAEVPELRGVNMHMQSENPDEPLDFDYLVKPGISRQANALAIVKMMGIDL
jgi:hypothetical protein